MDIKWYTERVSVVDIRCNADGASAVILGGIQRGLSQGISGGT